jgi:hypothetical protein
MKYPFCAWNMVSFLFNIICCSQNFKEVIIFKLKKFLLTKIGLIKIEKTGKDGSNHISHILEISCNTCLLVSDPWLLFVLARVCFNFCVILIFSIMFMVGNR